MPKILIVEDEPYERLELKAEVSTIYGANQVRGAESVEEAIAVLSSWKPDLILLDIRLKGKSGLEVARYVRKQQLRTEILIVTAYNEFEYAREAMTFGINYYLSKPVRPKLLLDTVREALQKYTAKVDAHSQSIWPLIQAGRESKAQDYLGFRVSSIVVAGFAKTCDKLDDYLEYLSTHLPLGRSKVELMEERVVAYLKDGFPEVDTELARLAQDFTHCFHQELVFGIADAEGGLTECYRRAIAACDHKIFYPDLRLLEYDQTVMERKNKFDYPVTMEQKLINLVKRGETTQIDELLQQMVPALISLSDRSFPVLRTWVEALVNSLKKMCISEGLLLNGISPLRPVSFWFSPEDLERDLKAVVGKIHAQASGKVRSEHPLIAKAINFLLEHFQEDISLLTVAQELNISSGYLSRLFKEEVGIPFKNYLITMRMDKAKQMLHQSGMAVSQVAFAVGYTDPNYFSEAFRKYEGVSPSEYKALKGT